MKIDNNIIVYKDNFKTNDKYLDILHTSWHSFNFFPARILNHTGWPYQTHSQVYFVFYELNYFLV